MQMVLKLILKDMEKEKLMKFRPTENYLDWLVYIAIQVAVLFILLEVIFYG
jgi:hypothetical protein